jgi:hypothetical protein
MKNLLKIIPNQYLVVNRVSLSHKVSCNNDNSRVECTTDKQQDKGHDVGKELRQSTAINKIRQKEVNLLHTLCTKFWFHDIT